MRFSPVPAAGLGWPTPPAMSCATRARPGGGQRGWRWRRCRPRPGTARSRPARIYLHLTSDWLAGQYRHAAALIDAGQAAVAAMVAAQEVTGL